MKYKIIAAVQVWSIVKPIRFGKRDVLSPGLVVESEGGPLNYLFIEWPTRGYIDVNCTERVSGEIPLPHPSDAALVTAIQATKAGCTLATYANILLRPVPRHGVKYSPVLLLHEEVERIRELNFNDPVKWRWMAREDSKQIYMTDGLHVKQTSVSGFYSGPIENRFKVLAQNRNWLMVETLRAGSGWWDKVIPEWCLHHVYTFRGYNPPCGIVCLPVITKTGYGWIEKWQVGL